MSNYHDARAFFNMALSDVERIIRNFKSRDFADCTFRIQFCSEKILKGLIFLYGGQFKKIHNPSIIIKDEILPKLSNLASDEKNTLIEIITDASILEDLSTLPRYGFEKDGHFIEPEAIYIEDSIITILPQLQNIIANLIKLLKNQEDNITWKEIIEEFENALKKFQDILDKKQTN